MRAEFPVKAAAVDAAPSPLSADLEQALSELIKKHRPGWSLEGPFYNDPRIFERDIERIFMHEWLLVDHASRIPNPGDYFLFEIAGESIIVVRGKDGEIRALFNVCRHRGSRVCVERSGSARALVCPYHAWTYGLDGELLSARAMPDGFDRKGFGLRRCGVRVVEGLIFISLAAEPPDREASFQRWERYLRPHGLTQARIAHRIVWTVKANWKLVIENYRECYHCGPSHPEYCSVMAHALPESIGSAQLAREYEGFRKAWGERAKAMGSGIEPMSGQNYVWSPEKGEPACICDRSPIKEGFLTQSRDGKPVAPLMGQFKAYDGGVTAGMIDPVNFFVASCDHAMIPRFTPIGPEVTEMELIWLVRADAVEAVDYRVDDLIWLWKVTTEQDKKIVEDNQAGVNSRAYVPGPYAEVEGGPKRFTLSYLRQIA